MMNVSRRAFLAGMAAAGSAALAGRWTFGHPHMPDIKSGVDRITLGRTGLKTSVLGIGTGTVGGSQQLAMGSDNFTKMVRHALDRGIHYIDTADNYSTHIFVRLALQKVPREKYFIQTKTRARSAEVLHADIERFRRELRVDYIDSVLMHCMTTPTWPTEMRPVMDALYEEKQKGRVKAVGVSCHGWEPLVASVDVDWVDIQLARINPFGMKMDGKPEDVAAVLKKMHDAGRGIIGMKIYGETGLNSRDERLQSLKYVLGLGCVDCFTIGFTSIEQIDETLNLIEQALQQGVHA
ncbi:Ferredoxin [Thermogutta terrifontis]|uniref:Ferredoxin n=2 Tax=Thermogutta TaxID=1676125 RepID=A0A286RHQ1_9BACT|nr:aldo/keto reductase [Thermogutta terrifontis]ASV75495.1 Ferredoxin [Thermogutta terrifontis]